MSDFSTERDFYQAGFWFDNPVHDDCDNFGSGFYANPLYSFLVTKLSDVPSDGYIVVLGTNRCVSFDILCEFFGYSRCIGYDLHNPTGHPRVIQRDCTTLSEADDIPIAFCHNDIGSFPTTPLLKTHCQRWAARNVVDGGYFLGRNDKNRAGFKAEAYMRGLGFSNQVLTDLTGQYDLSGLDEDCLGSHMLSRRERRES
jgi:hypothetical protein